MPRYYPIFLDLADKDILVVGAGSVGMRKIRSLAASSPGSILVVDPGMTDEVRHELAGMASVSVRKGLFAPDDLDGKALVFAATNNAELNAAIAAQCADRGIWCNIADAPGASSFIVPAQCNHDGVHIALSTGGLSPAVARIVREELEEFLGSRFSDLVPLLGRLRPHLLELGLPSEQNTEIFRTLARSSLPKLLSQNKYNEAQSFLLTVLPKALHPKLGEILHGV